ncbi:MAG: enoyl-CoA hydratase [Yangia sp.]|nr:enoyl-CoA hydratase [Salipiger sp.]
MLEIKTLHDLRDHVGATLSPSDWVEVTQETIDRFAELTLDDNWYHVDIERAARELPGGKTIAHGLYTLSLVPGLSKQIFRMSAHGRAFNYGYDKVRYPAPVPVGSRLRLHMSVDEAHEERGGLMICRTFLMELEGAEAPALVAVARTLAL